MAGLVGSVDAAAPPADVIGSSERRRELGQRLDERHRERLESQAQRRSERTAGAAQAEQADHFWAALEREEAAARAELALPDGADRAAVGDALDAASRRLQSVHRFIADSAAFLPAFELRRAQERARQLQQFVQQRQDQLVPRKRFGFRGQRAARAEPRPAEAAAPTEPATGADPAAAADQCGFSGQTDARLALGGAAVTGRDVTLTCLTRCTVRVTGAPATVHLSHLRDCRLLLGPVTSSVFLEDCQRCTLAAACQQLRAHTSADCDLYLHVTSRAVVEHCQRLRFAPYTLTGADVAADWATTGLAADTNNWSDVDDFNWLSKAQPSPNWSVLPEAERVTDWDGPAGGAESR
ncbi:tubulin-specific chaperone C-like [Amphibalanus amphitrite]|uniref:tubulin-specific chaperone C-like n=1 Tax=Amphibalanus amphitrite TaxID=1232801 RepID=UPI001C9008C2|nr:tubulin-specific chaperone C-like [Amphibalanus amphitrite]XP_043243368.1 tubulin-specific chaperone C-like [Amphibalanus amphitrite]XP_043243369.1 tubulin-specific chaperone C-like [Amphibalanus amphitrite]